MTKVHYHGAILFYLCFTCTVNTHAQSSRKAKTVLAVLLARNKEHTLPYFLALFENLTYPKDRISLFIRSDHNKDRTLEILDKWLSVHKHEYHSVDSILDVTSMTGYPYEGSPANWTDDRFDHIINLKEEALLKARHMWADYIWFIDLDVFIVDKDLLQNLIEEDKPIVSPMLNSLGTYSNYWCGMTDQYWYTRTEDYIPILERKKKGCFSVPMVHSCVLVDMTQLISDRLSFHSKFLPHYYGPKDDIIIFAVAAKTHGMEMFVCNEMKFGFIPPPLLDTDKFAKDYQQLIDIKLDILVEHPPLPVSTSLADYMVSDPPKNTLGFDHIYLINLLRRSDRRERMFDSFDVLGIQAELFEAVDGTKINISYLDALGVRQLSDYKDPWSKRDMKYGEIGCFLSHYFIWQDIVEKGYKKVIVFEDDIRFEPYFKKKLNYMMRQMKTLKLEWDLVYLGRKKLKKSDEPSVKGSDILVHVDYSYWTLCYIITLEGAKKLLEPQPLNKMVPVDEYIPIMYDRHPNDEWKSAFWPRNLKAFSASPLMVYPTHYTGEEGHISDTEDSAVIDDLLEISRNEPLGPPSAIPASSTIEHARMGIHGLEKDEL